MARPASAQAAINKDELEKLMRLYPSEKEASDWFDVSYKSLQRFIKTNFKCSFVQLRDKSFTKTRIAIKRKQIEKALAGNGDNTMLIWVGKQYLGQSDKMEQNLNVEDGAKKKANDTMARLNEIVNDRAIIIASNLSGNLQK